MPVSGSAAVVPLGTPILPRITGVTAYAFLGSSVATSATLGNGTLRAAPMHVLRTVAIDRIGLEVTVAGEAGAKMRMGMYRDNGNLHPGALLFDAGTVAADSIGIKEATVAQVLGPAVYWICAVIQDVVTTQPTLRTCTEIPYCTHIPAGSLATSTASDSVGIGAPIGNAVLPATFPTGQGLIGSIPRLYVRLA